MSTATERPTVAGVARNLLTTPRYVVGALAILALALVPSQLDTITVIKLTAALYFAMFVISWDFVSGYTNQVSFGHTFFFAIGGYTSALLNLEFGMGPLLSIPIGALLAGVGGLLLGIPALRVRGHYLALLTLMAPLILDRLFKVFSGTFGGETGLPQPETLVTGESYVATLELNYYLAYVLFTLVLVFAFVVTRSDIGKVFTAIREDEEAVSAAGINTAKFKLFAFVTSAILGGLAGAFLVHSPVGSPSPSQLLALVVMIDILIVSIVGGLGTIVGPALGGIFLFMLRDFLSGVNEAVPLVGLTVSDLNLIAFYSLTLVLLFFLPAGLLPWLLRLGRRLLDKVPGRDADLATDGGGREHRRPIDEFTDRLTGDRADNGDDTDE